MGRGKLWFYRTTLKMKNFFVHSLGILHEGLLLGVLNNRDLTEITQLYFQSSQQYQNDEYNLSGLFEWEKKVIGTYFKDCKTVLIGAAGGGREIIAVSNLGITVDAFECNPHLVDESKRLLDKVGIKARVVPSLPDNVPEELGIYDGMIVGWGGYMHIMGSDNRIRFLKQCREHIKPEGPVLLSFFMFHGTSGYQSSVFKIAKFFRTIRWNKEAFELGDSLKFAGYCHLFSKEEIEEELRKAGFQPVFFSDEEYSHAVGKAVSNERK